MDPVLLSRLQFATTTIYHFFFVPLTLGLSILLAVMETLYVRTGQEAYKRMTKFWGKLFLINFAMGVVTGIVQEFQFGMNWSEYSRYVGNIFGAPLAIEALLAFFLESTFLGLWIFGWERLSKKMHAITIWLVTLGSNISALWILIANSFMQNPVGYEIQEGQAVLASFTDLLLNPYLPLMFLHTFASGLATASFFIIGISAYHLWKKNEIEIFQRSFRMAAIVGLVMVISLAGIGHAQALKIMDVNPMKMVASEAWWDTGQYASMSMITIADRQNQRNIVDLRIPYGFSLLVGFNPSTEVVGINQLQEEYTDKYGEGDYVPPINLTNYSFRIMVGIAMLMILICIIAVIQILRKKSVTNIPLFRYLPFVVILPYFANSAGWLLTEAGRQPWIVFGLMKTADGISPTVTAGMVLASLIGFVVVYGLLMAADIYLLLKFAKAGPVDENHGVVLQPIEN